MMLQHVATRVQKSSAETTAIAIQGAFIFKHVCILFGLNDLIGLDCIGWIAPWIEFAEA